MSQDPREIGRRMGNALLSSAYLVLLPSGALFRIVAPGPLAYEEADALAEQVRGYLAGVPVIQDYTGLI